MRCAPGMSGAIVHVSKIRPLHLIAPEEVKVAEDLIFDRRARGLRSAAAPAGDLRRPQGGRCGQEKARRDGGGPAEGPHRRWRPQGADRRAGRGAEDATAARHHQHHAARRHEGGGRAVRRRQDAAAVRAAKRRDDEGRGGLSGAASWSGWRARRKAPSCWRP